MLCARSTYINHSFRIYNGADQVVCYGTDHCLNTASFLDRARFPCQRAIEPAASIYDLKVLWVSSSSGDSEKVNDPPRLEQTVAEPTIVRSNCLLHVAYSSLQCAVRRNVPVVMYVTPTLSSNATNLLMVGVQGWGLQTQCKPA